MLELYPLTFEPVLKDYIWGGRNLARLGRDLPAEGTIAESWDIAAHEAGDSVVANGRFAGQSLSKVTAALGLDLIGSNNSWAHERGKFPLLIKLLDANRPLSVQVHPDDDFAQAHEGSELGKTEMWVVLHAEPGAEVILGVKVGTTPAGFKAAIEKGHLEPYLHHLPVKSGDHICVPAGSLHAIMGGLLIAEIQQNSNTTYRVYDWNRAGAGGRPRPLHVEKALQVINFAQVEPALTAPHLISQSTGVARWELCRNPYFVVERVLLAAGAAYTGHCDGRSLEIWGVLQGEAQINGVVRPAVSFTLLPAALGSFKITTSVSATLLRTYSPAENDGADK